MAKGAGGRIESIDSPGTGADPQVAVFIRADAGDVVVAEALPVPGSVPEALKTLFRCGRIQPDRKSTRLKECKIGRASCRERV